MNTVRSIIHDHGNLIDRHTIMARIAISGGKFETLYSDGTESKFFLYFNAHINYLKEVL